MHGVHMLCPWALVDGHFESWGLAPIFWRLPFFNCSFKEGPGSCSWLSPPSCQTGSKCLILRLRLARHLDEPRASRLEVPVSSNRDVNSTV